MWNPLNCKQENDSCRARFQNPNETAWNNTGFTGCTISMNYCEKMRDVYIPVAVVGVLGVVGLVWYSRRKKSSSLAKTQ